MFRLREESFLNCAENLILEKVQLCIFPLDGALIFHKHDQQ